MSASKDANFVSSVLATSEIDGHTTIPIKINPSTNRVKVNFGSGGVDLGDHNADKDDNRVSGIMGVSSADGKTLIPIFCTSTGYLKVKSN